MAESKKDVDVSQLKFNRDLNFKTETKTYSPTATLRPSKRTYLVEELFFDIEGDPDHVIFKIPEAIAEELQWGEGDTISIETTPDKQGFIMKKADNVNTLVTKEVEKK